MLIIGLTGSIGSGKSLAAHCFAEQGVPVHDSDAEVHKLYAKDSSLVQEIQKRWPEAVESGQVIRPNLGKKVFANIDELKTLESLIFPRLEKSHRAFLRTHSQMKTPMVVIDMPLLFEVNFDEHVDVSICVYADTEVRKQRVMRRKHMTEDAFAKRDGLQMPQEKKAARADYVLHSGLDKGHMFRQVKQLIQDLRDRKGQAWGPQWKANSKREDRDA